MLADGSADTSGILLMSSTKIDPWDPSGLRLAPADAAGSELAPRRGRRAPSVRGRFVAGPIDVAWLARARKLGVTALWVGLGLWHLKGLRRADTFIVSNLMMQSWEVSPDAKSRALRALEKAGLIAIEPRGKRSPRVSLLLS
jgi:hypothetical protein